jgi:hypothetical protein
MTTSKILFNEQPLVISPSLAKYFGLNESIVIQQLHYWLQKSKNEIDGRVWMYNTYKDWLEQFPFWSLSTIRRTLTALETSGIVITANYNKTQFDKTKWYSLDYQRLEAEYAGKENEEFAKAEKQSMNSPGVQNEQTECSMWADGNGQDEQTNTRDYAEITTENLFVSTNAGMDVAEKAVQRGKVKYKYDLCHMQLAERLKNWLVSNKPNIKLPASLDQWANTIRLMMEMDRREYVQIVKVMDWSQRSTFWKVNILSADKLREKFDRLEMQMTERGREIPSGRSAEFPSEQLAWEEVLDKLIIHKQRGVVWSHEYIARAVKQVGYLTLLNQERESKSSFIKAYNEVRRSGQ